MLRKRVTIFTGHFGSGKTEIALNAALTERKKSPHIAIADLDVINPYFRSRDQAVLLKKEDIKLIAPHDRLAQADLPIVSGDIYRFLHDERYVVIIDAGGDKDGATALGQYYNDWKTMDIDLLFILNSYRPYVSSIEGIVATINNIERASRLKVTGIINNSNIGSETTMALINKGESLAKRVALKLDIPFLYTTLSSHHQQDEMTLKDCYVIERFMKVPWE